MKTFKCVIKRSGAKVPFKLERIANAIYRAAVAVGGRDKEKAQFLAEQVLQNLRKNFPADHDPHIEEIQDCVEKTLIKNGNAQVAKVYILYRNEKKQKRDDKALKASIPSQNIPWSKLWKILDWTVDHDLHTIEAINKHIRNKRFPHVIHECEELYQEDIGIAAKMIAERGDDLKMVFVSGPSSSGKTTTTIKLEEDLNKIGLKFKAFVVDNYFFDLAMHPKDEFGDYDFETPQALDIPLINEHISKLCNGEEVLIPFYDFKTGTRHLERSKMKLKKGEILLIDSLHGLYPPMSESISDNQKFKVYIESLLQVKDNDGKYIRWSDIRMMRRMLRDASHRAYKPQQTLEHWHYVRASEMRHIIPNQTRADYIISSGMPYELPLYKASLFAEFEKWKDAYRNNPEKEDADLRAQRTFNVLKQFEAVEDDSPVPKDSVLREFIGGSKYEY
ncbi:MAG: response regulator SirA [Candidatus Cloacimonetes bacterium]|nr:response regulator SirA [Candidatus Cloacimonadota bacterium]MCF7813234.1 response regulator SirA [Candidatus Cloacimonadota bacterium]MCF7867433.1 response regulator SirA [Candidatus Cloacimonadota bacterium]MCF7882935.1 response regulator SirA [Candidatus Cloacimonadota bacterium]